MRGPVPADPEIRSAARRLAGTQLETILRLRTWSMIFFSFLLALAVFNVVVNSPWYLVTAVLAATLIFFYWYLPKRLRKRIELLSAAE
jgi:Flp pilus assembly protein TadB